MRMAVGGFEHETNSFSNKPVTAQSVAAVLADGPALIERYRGVRCTMGGYIDECAARGIELVPAMYADIPPCAPTVQTVFEDFRDRFVEELWAYHQEQPLDAIALTLHGAGIAEGYPDLETEILRALRARFGSEMPIGVVLDLHGNITEEMMTLCDISLGYKSYPHVDTYDSARKMAALLHEHLTTGKRFYQALVRLPWHLPPAMGVTLSGPAHDIMVYDEQLTASEPTLRDVTFYQGFPYGDVPFSGVSVSAVAEDPEDAQRFAAQAADYAWSRRTDFDVPVHSAEQAVALAEQAEAPVVINEGSDNPGGGAPGDGTHLLRVLIERDLPGTAFGYICDPETVQQAIAAGVGQTIDCRLGGKTDTIHGTPVEVKGAYVKTISDGTFIVKNPMGAGARRNLGPSVLLQVGNVSVVLASKSTQTLDDGPFRMVGLDWQDLRIAALKSAQHFKGWWTGRAKSIVSCDSPGIHSADLSIFDYQALDKSYYPFNPDRTR